VDRTAEGIVWLSTRSPGARQAQEVTFAVDKSAMSFYSPAKKDWAAEPGAFEVLEGGVVAL